MALHDKITEQEIEEMVSLYKESKSSYKVAKQIGRSQHAVLRHLRQVVPELVENNRTSVPNNTRRKKYTVNHNYFQTIDTQEKAYILGFLYADGYVNEKGTLEIGLHPKDNSVLEFIKTQLESSAPIKSHHSASSHSKVGLLRLCIHSKKLVNDLVKYGCVQNKTFKISFPTFLQKDLVKHFIRGYFDGDGCIYNVKKNNTFGISIASNITFLEGMGKYLQNEIGLSKITIYKNNKIGYLKYHSKTDIDMLYHCLYDQATCFLQRKYNIFQDFLEKLSKQTYIDTSRIIELYKKEKSLVKVAKQLNIATMTVYKRIKKEQPSLFIKPNFDESKILLIQSLFKQGLLGSQIIKQTGFPASSVYRHIK